MRPEVGKYYLMRNGEVCGPIVKWNPVLYVAPLTATGLSMPNHPSQYTFMANGESTWQTQFDLREEYALTDIDPREKPLTEAAIAATGDYNPHFAVPGETALMETRLFLARWDALQALPIPVYLYGSNPANAALAKYREDFPATLARYEAADKETAHLDRTKRVIVDHDGQYIAIPMILWCPNCGTQHIDAAEPHKATCHAYQVPPEVDVKRQQGGCTCDRWANPPHRSHLCHECGEIWRPADVPTTGVKEIETRGKDDQGAVRGMISIAARYKRTEVIFRREECMFPYCPTVGLCQGEGNFCKHPKTSRNRDTDLR